MRARRTKENDAVSQDIVDVLKQNIESTPEETINHTDINITAEVVEKKDEGEPVTWESEIRKQVMGFVDNMLVVAQECNMGTIYIKPVKAQYEGYAEYDEGKASGAELRLVFKFIEPIDLSKVNLV